MPFINDCDPATALVFSPGLGCFQVVTITYGTGLTLAVKSKLESFSNDLIHNDLPQWAVSMGSR
jgi:hypothetical protein